MKNYKQHIITGLYIIYLLLLPVFLFTATVPQFILLFVMYWFFSDFILSKVNHCWAAHGWWEPPGILKYIFGFIGTTSMVGSPIGWTAWHLKHHKYSDTDKDPHYMSVNHILSVGFLTRYHKTNIRYAKRLLNNKILVFMQKYELSLILITNLLLFLLLPFNWFLALWALPAAYTLLITGIITNAVAHWKWKRRDLLKYKYLLWPIQMSSEGLNHKDHHENGKFSDFRRDIGYWIIKKLKWG